MGPSRRPCRRGAAAFLVAAAALLGGCQAGGIEPWVQPYERQNLADPIMQFNRANAPNGFMMHLHHSREGARGAEGGSGGGCGCT